MAENVTPMPIEEKMKKASTTLATMLDYLGLDANVKAEEISGISSMRSSAGRGEAENVRIRVDAIWKWKSRSRLRKRLQEPNGR